MDGSFVDMTPVLASILYIAQMTREQQIFAYAETLYEQCKAADYPEQVDIDTGWPPHYTPAEE